VFRLEAIAPGDQAILKPPLPDRDAAKHVRGDAKESLEGLDAEGVRLVTLFLATMRTSSFERPLEERLEVRKKLSLEAADPVRAKVEFVGKARDGASEPG
jgi:hypothetical protein